MENNQLDKEGMPKVCSSDNQIDSEGMPAEREETKRVDEQMSKMC